MSHPKIVQRAAAAALLAATVACSGRDSGGAGAAAKKVGDSEVVATLNGHEIVASELEAWIKDDLYKREIGDKPAGEAYEVRAQAIDSLIDDRLLEEAAKKAGKTSDAFLADQVKALGEVSNDEIKAFFDENRQRLPPDATIEAYSARIKSHLESQRPDKVRADLRKNAQVAVLMQPPRVNVEASGPSRGPADAAVTLVEFSDYQCPFCKRAEPTVLAIMAKYPTQVRLVYRHMPLDGLHPRARAAAIAAVCAEQQGKFWEYHDLLFSNQQALADADLEKYGADLGLDAAKFKACRADPASEARVNVDATAARAAGLTGTPAFFVNGILISGARPLEDFTRWIDSEIAAKGSAPKPPAS
ncbi:MAG: thioredoxin domain-containing protein [Myxococcota bacterium]